MCLSIDITDKEESEKILKVRKELLKDIDCKYYLHQWALLWEIKPRMRANPTLNEILDNHAQIAQKNIVCYKWLDTNYAYRTLFWRMFHKEILQAPLFGKTYHKHCRENSDMKIAVDDIGVTFTNPSELECSDVYLRISHGIHVLINKPKTNSYGGDRLYKCIIPKGTRYVMSEDEIAAETIIVKRRVIYQSICV